jgi:signal transduction histidine kinase
MDYSVSYLSLIHGLLAGAGLLLALSHVFLAYRSHLRRHRHMYMMSSVMAASASVAIIAELHKALAVSPEAYLEGLRIVVLGVYLMVIALMNFIRLYFNGRIDKLFMLTAIVWTVGTFGQFLNFPTGFYSEISGLTSFETFWGEPYSKIVATVSAIKYIADVGTVLVLTYLVRTTLRAHRLGDRKRAWVVGGSSIGFLVVAGILVPLDDAGLLRNSLPLGWPFLALVIALTYQLIDDQARSQRLQIEVEQLRRASLAGEIAAGLIHELNQPLTSILSNSQAARRFLEADEPDLDEVKAAIDDVVSEDKRAAGIIHGLRNLLHRNPKESEQCNMNETIREVSTMLAGEFLTGHARLELSLDSARTDVSASGIQLQQVLLNLLVNALRAVKSSPASGRHVHISSQVAGDSVRVVIKDSGPGVPEELIERVFEPFTSGSDSLGMGLAICRRILTLHGGAIRVENRVHGGAKFTFELPLAGASKAE